MAVQLSGGAIFLAGAILGIADMIQLVSLFPFADKMAMAIGAAIWAFGQNMD